MAKQRQGPTPAESEEGTPVLRARDRAGLARRFVLAEVLGPPGGLHPLRTLWGRSVRPSLPGLPSWRRRRGL